MLLSPSRRMRSLSTASRQITIPPRYAAYAMVLIMAVSVNSYFDRVSEIEAEDREASGADSGEPVVLSTTLWSEGFETVGNTADGGSRYALAASTASGASAIVESSDGSEDYVTRSDGSNIKSDNDVSSDGGGTWGAAVGSWSFGIHDQDGAPTPCDPCVLTWSGIDISSYTGLEFSGYFAEDDDSSNQDWDAGDKLEVEVSIDSGSWTDIFMISGGYGGASTNAAPYTDTDFDGVGDGTEITDTWQSFTSSISGTGSSMDIRVVVSSLTQTDTDIWFDALQIVGTAASGDCAAGQYSSDGQAPCTPCPAGSFSRTPASHGARPHGAASTPPAPATRGRAHAPQAATPPARAARPPARPARPASTSRPAPSRTAPLPRAANTPQARVTPALPTAWPESTLRHRAARPPARPAPQAPTSRAPASPGAPAPWAASTSQEPAPRPRRLAPRAATPPARAARHRARPSLPTTTRIRLACRGTPRAPRGRAPAAQRGPTRHPTARDRERTV